MIGKTSGAHGVFFKPRGSICHPGWKDKEIAAGKLYSACTSAIVESTSAKVPDCSKTTSPHPLLCI
jgi:hypothetical protein